MKRALFGSLVFVLFPLAALAQGAQSPSASSAELSPATSFETAQNLAAKGRLDKAMALLDQLAAQNPEPAGVERLRGIIFYQREDFARAIDAFAKASQQDPADR